MLDEIEFINIGNTTLLNFIFNNKYKNKIYNEEIKIDKNNVFIIHCFSDINQIRSILPYLEKGNKFILDRTWELELDERIPELLRKYSKNAMTIMTSALPDTNILGRRQSVPMFFWYNEFLHYHRNKQFIPLCPNPTSINFLMPIGSEKDFRTKFVEQLGNRLQNSIYSMIYQKIYLPNDLPLIDNQIFPGWDRYNNPDWYKLTGYSVVLESFIDKCIYISEKTFKPIANGHPFLVLGSPGVLATLRDNGFKTFNGIIDECYDNETDLDKRIQLIISQMDLITTEKLNEMREIVIHNRNRFFNKDLVHAGITRDFKYPIEEFCLG